MEGREIPPCDMDCAKAVGGAALLAVPGGAAVKGAMFLRANKFYGPSKRNGRIFGFRNRSNPKQNTYRLDYHNNPHNTKLHNHGVNDIPKDGFFR